MVLASRCTPSFLCLLVSHFAAAQRVPVVFTNSGPVTAAVHYVHPEGFVGKLVAELPPGGEHREGTSEGALFKVMLSPERPSRHLQHKMVKVEGRGGGTVNIGMDNGDGSSTGSLRIDSTWKALSEEEKRSLPNIGGDYAPQEIKGSEALMEQKAHGTCGHPAQQSLRWQAEHALADRISCWNRHGAEPPGYWEQGSNFLQELKDPKGEVTFFDSITGKPLFVAPRNRTWAEFVKESRDHGWPSFRDDEVVPDSVRILANGEAVSVDGTHLGHNIPDSAGNRYCINLVSVAGQPSGTEEL